MSELFQKQGTHGKDLATKKPTRVTNADFARGGLIMYAERRYDQVIRTKSFPEWQDWFGTEFSSSRYGYGQAEKLFQNLLGVSGDLYTYSRPGYSDASTLDAVQASKNAVDGDSAAALDFKAGNREVIEYGVSGNRTGFKTTQGDRSTLSIAVTYVPTETDIYVDSVADVYVGDILKIDASGGTPGIIYLQVTAVEESSKKISFAAAITPEIPTLGDTVTVRSFKVQTYRKDINGLVTEQQVSIADEWVTNVPDTGPYYVKDVFNPRSFWMIIEDLSPITTDADKILPADTPDIVWLESGADGTNASTVTQWARSLAAFDNLPVRYLGNVETTNEDVYTAGELYCNSRVDDKPKWIGNFQKDPTKAQAIELGRRHQRSNYVSGLGVTTWLKVSDPFSTSPNAPAREIPNVGAIIGSTIYAKETYGIHYSPATEETSIQGIVGLVNDNMPENFDDGDRTNVLNAGLNMIIEAEGGGYRTGNLVTFSTAKEWVFSEAGIMNSFIRVSVIDSLRSKENKPTTFARGDAQSKAITTFMYKLYSKGSTGGAPLGETFGASAENPNFLDLVEVQFDPINNPQEELNLGNTAFDIWFNIPSPNGSITIGTGRLVL